MQILVKLLAIVANYVDIIRQKFFAGYMESIAELYNKAVHEEKVILFKKLNEQKSLIPEYKQKGSIRIVELGPGSGTNLRYLPKHSSLLVVDPNPFFEQFFRKALEEIPSIDFEGYKIGYGENLDFIKDDSVDAVVVTAVNCSVKDVQQVYKEIKRILVPGGKFYYVDHILGKPGTWTYYKQKIVAASRIWKFIFYGCNIDRNLDYQINQTGFSKVEQKLFNIDKSLYFGFQFCQPHIAGVATK